MKKIVLLVLAMACSAWSQAIAQPVTLKLAYFSSDRSTVFVTAIQPFVDAVNTAAAGLATIEIYPSGTLGRDPNTQLHLVLDGTADIAFIIPGYTPDRFPDNDAIELPGLFKGIRESTLVYTRLIQAGVLRGYEDLVVIGAYGTEPGSIHSRLPIGSLDDLVGQRIRANNPIEALTMQALGMTTTLMPFNQASNAISAGTLDATGAQASPLVEFGISRVATNHFLLGVVSSPLALVMSRRSFDSLPLRAQEIIRELSGEWAAERYIAAHELENARVVQMLSADPGRHVVIPSASDQERAAAVFAGIVETWVASDPRNAELLAEVQNELLNARQDL